MSNMANTPNRSMVVSAADKQKNIKSFFEEHRGAIEAVLPKHVTPDRLMKLALSLTSKDSKLLACKPVSLFRCVVAASSLGLEVGGQLGEAYLVPFKDECTLIVGYRGLVRLARNSGEIKNIRSRVVYKGDTFQVKYGIEETIIHEPNLSSAELADEDIIAVYAIAEFVEGSPQFEVMTRAQVDKIRKRSASGNEGPWVTDYAEQARKTVLRRLSKMLPLSAEKSEAFHKAIAHDNAQASGERSPIIDIPVLGEDGDEQVQAPKDRVTSLTERVAANGARVTHDTNGVVVEESK